MLCSLTLYKALKKKYPDARITLVAAKTNYPIPFFEINQYIDQVLTFDKSNLKTMAAFLRKLRSRKYQLGIVPSTIAVSRTSHIINFTAGIKLRVGVNTINGEGNKSRGLLNIKKDFDWNNKHQLIRNLEVVKQIDCDLTEDEINSIQIELSDENFSFAEEFFSEHFPDKQKKVFAFHPGAGKTQNIWPTEKFFSLIKNLFYEHKNYVLITSGWTDESIVERLAAKLKSQGIAFAVLHNASIKNLGAVIKKTHLFITNDTGTMHVAGFCGAKMIALFGPTYPEEWAPRGKDQLFVKSPSIEINDIGVDDVLLKAKSILN